MRCGAERLQAGHHRCLHEGLLQRPEAAGEKHRQDCRAGRIAEVIPGQEGWHEGEQQASQGEGERRRIGNGRFANFISAYF